MNEFPASALDERRRRRPFRDEEREEEGRTVLNWLVSRYTDWRSERSTVSERTTASTPDESPDETGVEGDADRTATASHGTPAESADARASWRDLLDGKEVSKQEVQMTLGIQPHEFLVWLVRDAGGHMWQADMVDATGWSKSTVSRYLDTLESSGLVERVWIGRRKLVGVPGQMPDPVSTPDGFPVEPTPDGRSSEADEPA